MANFCVSCEPSVIVRSNAYGGDIRCRLIKCNVGSVVHVWFLGSSVAGKIFEVDFEGYWAIYVIRVSHVRRLVCSSNARNNGDSIRHGSTTREKLNRYC